MAPVLANRECCQATTGSFSIHVHESQHFPLKFVEKQRPIGNLLDSNWQFLLQRCEAVITVGTEPRFQSAPKHLNKIELTVIFRQEDALMPSSFNDFLQTALLFPEVGLPRQNSPHTAVFSRRVHGASKTSDEIFPEYMPCNLKLNHSATVHVLSTECTSPCGVGHTLFRLSFPEQSSCHPSCTSPADSALEHRLQLTHHPLSSRTFAFNASDENAAWPLE